MKDLREFTPARVTLGLTGDSLPTRPLLDFRLSHARARDAVHLPFDDRSLAAEAGRLGWHSIIVSSRAASREEYLKRPDLGQLLSPGSERELKAWRGTKEMKTVFVVGDGLSALAVHQHAIPLLQAISDTEPIEALVLARQARVALGDHIGEVLGADLVLVLIGERPGLSSADSLGVYLTWAPKCGRTDAERNCLSNIHPRGLSYEIATQKLVYLIREARSRRLTGVGLKEFALIP